MKGTSLPFHIFEPKYLQMVEMANREDLKIAVSHSRSNGEYIGQVCVAGPMTIVQENPNGTKLIVISGESKYKLMNMTQEKPFRCFEAKKLDERPLISQSNREDLAVIRDYFRAWADRNVHNEQESNKIYQVMDNDEQLIGYSTLFLLKDVHEKQKILEALSFDEKIQMIKKFLLPKEIKLGEFLPSITTDED